VSLKTQRLGRWHLATNLDSCGAHDETNDIGGSCCARLSSSLSGPKTMAKVSTTRLAMRYILSDRYDLNIYIPTFNDAL
jgi:hypothetical protein